MSKKKRDKSYEISVPAEKELYGVRIVKLPIARYLRALNTLESLPHIMITELAPAGEDLGLLLQKIMSGDKQTIEAVFFRLIKTFPTEILKLVSDLLNIPEDRLLDPNNESGLSLKELLEILIAFWEMNDLTDFFQNVRRLRLRLTAQKEKANSGYSVG